MAIPIKMLLLFETSGGLYKKELQLDDSAIKLSNTEICRTFSPSTNFKIRLGTSLP